MSTVWDEARIQSYIDNQIEEELKLDYKAAPALEKSSKKIDEITKDVSAFANSAGGIIIYGVREFQDDARKHLAERIDPIDRRNISREWLDQIIGRIQPRPSVVIYSVQLQSGPNDVAYVVEIPPGTTAHQAANLKYYRRYNFESVAMQHYEILDIMRRKTVPKVTTSIKLLAGPGRVYNHVKWAVENESDILVKHVTSSLYVPALLEGVPIYFPNAKQHVDEDGYHSWFIVRSNEINVPLFPRASLSSEIPFDFSEIDRNLKVRDQILYRTFADEMPSDIGLFDISAILERLEPPERTDYRLH